MQPKPRFKLQELSPAVLQGAKDDPLVTFHISKRGKEILDDAARDSGITVSQFIRRAVLHEIVKVYGLTE